MSFYMQMASSNKQFNKCLVIANEDLLKTHFKSMQLKEENWT